MIIEVKINFELFKAIRDKGLRQRDFAKIVGDHESVVSLIVNDVWVIDEVRKAPYARALGCKSEDLFSG